MPREKNLDGKTRRAIREEVEDQLADEGVPAVRTEQAIVSKSGRSAVRKYHSTPIGTWTDGEKYGQNPVLTTNDVSTDSSRVADPWPVVHDGTLYVFFENDYSQGGAGIYVAESSDARNYNVRNDIGEITGGVYPYVFRHKDHFYLWNGGTASLFRTTVSDFPAGWSQWQTYNTPELQDDVGIMRHQGLWYYFIDDRTGDYLNFYTSPTLDTDRVTAGGSFLLPVEDSVKSGMIHRILGPDRSEFMFVNYQSPRGDQVRQALIHDLAPNRISITDMGVVLEPTQGWEGGGNHHLGIVRFGDEYVAVYDGGGASFEIGVAFREVGK